MPRFELADLKTHPLRYRGEEWAKNYLSLLGERSKRGQKAREAEIRACARDPWWCITGWFFTHDEKEQGGADGEITPMRFPDKEYLRYAVYCMFKHQLLLISKSRQLMFSWLRIAIYTWEGLFLKYRKCGIRSKNEDDADKLIARAAFIHDNLPAWMRDPLAKKIMCKLSLPRMSNIILGLPSGSDMFRSNSCSDAADDEFQEDPTPKKTIDATLPVIKGRGPQDDGTFHGGYFCGIFTAKSSAAIKDIVFDTPLWKSTDPKNRGHNPDPVGRYRIFYPMKGIREWETRTGFHVLEVHYSSDPDKDPDTERGRIWFEYAKQGFQESWDEEMEIDWECLDGDALFPTFKEDIHCIDSYRVREGVPVIRCDDFGYNYPFMALMQFNELGQLVIFGEITRSQIVIDDFVPLTKLYISGGKDDQGNYHKGMCPGALFCTFCDPAGEKMTHRSRRTDVQVLQLAGFPAQCSVVHSIDKNRLMNHYLKIREDGLPGLLIVAPECHVIVAALKGKLVRDEKKKGTSDEGSPKDVHPFIDGYDAVTYGMRGVTVLETMEILMPERGFGQYEVNEDEFYDDAPARDSKESYIGQY